MKFVVWGGDHLLGQQAIGRRPCLNEQMIFHLLFTFSSFMPHISLVTELK